MPTEPSAKVIADSISPEGVRLTTFEITCHRFVLAEFNTHRTLSRNSASSRAIPFPKQVERVQSDPAIPVVWPKEQKGMQGGEALDSDDSESARWYWLKARTEAVRWAGRMSGEHSIGVHKSVLNRLLEPFMWHTIVCTATAWENFFEQRCSPLAQPEIKAVADLMQAAYREHQPKALRPGEWHLPYIGGEDYAAMSRGGLVPLGVSMYPELVKVSAARCARVSYLTQDGKRDLQADLALYERLTTAQPAHWSPLEHVATPWPENFQEESIPFDLSDGHTRCFIDLSNLPMIGNLLGWRSLRTEVEARQQVSTFR